MTESERITALEARLAKAEARIAELEARAPLGMIGPAPVGKGWGPDFPPGWMPPNWPVPIVTKCGETGMPPADYSPSTSSPGDVIRAVATKPEPTLGQEVAGEIRSRREIREDAANGNVAYRRWLGTV